MPEDKKQKGAPKMATEKRAESDRMECDGHSFFYKLILEFDLRISKGMKALAASMPASCSRMDGDSAVPSPGGEREGSLSRLSAVARKRNKIH